MSVMMFQYCQLKSFITTTVLLRRVHCAACVVRNCLHNKGTQFAPAVPHPATDWLRLATEDDNNNLSGANKSTSKTLSVYYPYSCALEKRSNSSFNINKSSSNTTTSITGNFDRNFDQRRIIHNGVSLTTHLLEPSPPSVTHKRRLSTLCVSAGGTSGCRRTNVVGCGHLEQSLLSQSLQELSIASKRKQSSQSSDTPLVTVADVARYISDEAGSVLVMTGAGISTASGIPDFRSPKTGLYHNLQKYNLPYPEAIFDINFFMMDPQPFVSLAQELYPGTKYRPNAAHYFLRLLEDKGKLHRVYTQNIDGLERLSGLSPSKLLEAHGSFSAASCTLCGAAHDPAAVKESILHRSTVPQCGIKGCKGKVKPDIVFFGENLPSEFWRFEEDLHAVDLLLIMGTSLEVYPFASIADSARTITPRVLLNSQRAGSLGTRPRDCVLQGDIVETVTQLAAACGWENDLQQLLAQGNETHT